MTWAAAASLVTIGFAMTPGGRPSAPATADANEMKQSLRVVRVWDLPTRIVHWGFAGLIPFLWWTGTHYEWQLHILGGEILLGLLIFRVMWAFVGSSTARLFRMVRVPSEVLRYAKTLASAPYDWVEPGHNPLGAWSAIAMLMAMSTLTITGLFAVSLDGLTEGPLAAIGTDAFSRLATEWHHQLFAVLLCLVVLHLVAIVFYTAVKRQAIVPSMVHGRRLLPIESAPVRPARIWMFALTTWLAIAVVVAIILGSPP